MLGPPQLKHQLKHLESLLSSRQNIQCFDSEQELLSMIDDIKLMIQEERNKIPTAVQIKEKFGSLRFYADNITDEQQIIINFAETLSSKVCEFCGRFDSTVISYRIGWHKTLCSCCANKEKQ